MKNKQDDMKLTYIDIIVLILVISETIGICTMVHHSRIMTPNYRRKNEEIVYQHMLWQELKHDLTWIVILMGIPGLIIVLYIVYIYYFPG